MVRIKLFRLKGKLGLDHGQPPKPSTTIALKIPFERGKKRNLSLFRNPSVQIISWPSQSPQDSQHVLTMILSLGYHHVKMNLYSHVIITVQLVVSKAFYYMVSSFFFPLSPLLLLVFSLFKLLSSGVAFSLRNSLLESGMLWQ